MNHPSRPATLAVIVTLLTTGPAASAADPGRDRPAEAAPVPRAGAVGAYPDFDHDGYADIVIPSPLENVDGRAEAGAVFVVYGSRWGPRMMSTQRWTENSSGVSGTAETGDQLGYGWAAGDFDHDGYHDLAVSAPGEDFGTPTINGAGAVHVLYGGPDGLAASGNRVFTQASPEVPGDPSDNDRLGLAALAAGDFDGDGYDDLAAPITDDKVGSVDRAGSVLVLPGSRWGMTARNSLLFNESSSGIVGTPKDGDFWSYAGMVTGDWNGDGRADLYVPAPYVDIDGPNAGGFHILYGSSSGLRGSGSDFFGADSPGFPGDPKAGGLLGLARPAVADIDGDGLDDLALPWFNADVTVGGTERASAGAVIVLHGSAGGLTTAGNVVWSQQTPQVPGWSTANGRWGFFGAATGDFDGDGNVDIALASMYEVIGGNPNSGALYILRTDGNERIRRANRITEDTAGLEGSGADRYFTDGVPAVGDWHGDGYDDLGVAVTLADLPGRNNTGATYLFRGQRWAGITGGEVRYLTQDTAGIPSSAAAGEVWGFCCY